MTILSPGCRSARRSTAGSWPETDIITGTPARSAAGHSQSAVPSAIHGRCSAVLNVKRMPSMPG
jgi:hypothetical protein